MNAALAKLRAVADLLSLVGRVEVLHGGRSLWFEGHEALFVNPSNALVMGALRDGATVVLRAVNVAREARPEDITADILARFAGRRAA